jgi:hypothetical protein
MGCYSVLGSTVLPVGTGTAQVIEEPSERSERSEPGVPGTVEVIDHSEYESDICFVAFLFLAFGQ